MDMKDKLALAGIRPTAQRTLIAELVFGGLAHPSADEVFKAATNSEQICFAGNRLQYAQRLC